MSEELNRYFHLMLLLYCSFAIDSVYIEARFQIKPRYVRRKDLSLVKRLQSVYYVSAVRCKNQDLQLKVLEDIR